MSIPERPVKVLVIDDEDRFRAPSQRHPLPLRSFPTRW